MLENEEQLAERRLKLDYKDLRADKICVETWDRLLSQESLSQEDLRGGVSVGVPQARRGEAWQVMIARSDTSRLTELSEKFPNMTAKYNSLKSQLTSYQHAILIDLGKINLSHLETSQNCKSLQEEPSRVTGISAAPSVLASAVCSIC